MPGTYHKLSVRHLDAYLDELEWRFNEQVDGLVFVRQLQLIEQFGYM